MILKPIKEKYSLVDAGQKLQIPYLIIQGTNDQAVKMEEFNLLKHLVKQKSHVILGQSCFGGSHLFRNWITRAYSELVVTKEFSCSWD
jgi:surfactin synthase thioesterase subunit